MIHRWRVLVILLVLVLTLAYALPNIPILGTALAPILPDSRVNLGLDLKGGIHLTLGVEVDKAVSNSLAITGQDLRREGQEKKIAVLRPRVVGGTTLEFLVPRASDEEPLTIMQIVDALGLLQPTVSMSVSALATQGLVTRDHEASGSHTTSVSLTREGRAAAADVTARIEEIVVRRKARKSAETE